METQTLRPGDFEDGDPTLMLQSSATRVELKDLYISFLSFSFLFFSENGGLGQRTMKAYDTVSKSVFNENGLDLGESVSVGFDRTINVFFFFFFGKVGIILSN